MKSNRAIYLKKIIQIDNFSFSIEWNDGRIGKYFLSNLQRLCPCAGCHDESTGKKILDPQSLQTDVKAIRIQNVGRYALRIEFTSGCSTGIYDYNMLYDMMKS